MGVELTERLKEEGNTICNCETTSTTRIMMSKGYRSLRVSTQLMGQVRVHPVLIFEKFRVKLKGN